MIEADEMLDVAAGVRDEFRKTRAYRRAMRKIDRRLRRSAARGYTNALVELDLLGWQIEILASDLRDFGFQPVSVDGYGNPGVLVDAKPAPPAAHDE